MAKNEKINIRVCLFGREKFSAHDIGMNTRRTFNQEHRRIVLRLFQKEGRDPTSLGG